MIVQKPLHPQHNTDWCSFLAGGEIGPQNNATENKFGFNEKLKPILKPKTNFPTNKLS